VRGREQRQDLQRLLGRPNQVSRRWMVMATKLSSV
jgi:hypothetical protein